MNRSIVVLVTLSILLGILIFWVLPERAEDADETSSPLPAGIAEPGAEPGSEPELENNVDSEPYMQAASGGRVSTLGLIEHPNAVMLTDGFYQVTTDPDRFDIFYNDGNKNVFILLYQEPLNFTRRLAEEELLATLSVSQAAICDLGVQVRTNEYVNARYAGFNLGLSFCPSGMSLENI